MTLDEMEAQAKRDTKSDNEHTRSDGEKLLREVKAIKAELAPAGGLGLSKHLDAARLKHGITNGAFEFQPVFDRIYVRQVAQYTQTFGGGAIVMTDVSKAKAVNASPVGVLVAAGLGALDHLQAHGIILGDVVGLLQYSPFFYRYDVIDGKERFLLILRVGDITMSMDLRERLKRREVRIRHEPGDADKGVAGGHVLIDGEGKKWAPTEPFIGDDY